jgi:hypothetical protein
MDAAREIAGWGTRSALPFIQQGARPTALEDVIGQLDLLDGAVRPCEWCKQSGARHPPSANNRLTASKCIPSGQAIRFSRHCSGTGRASDLAFALEVNIATSATLDPSGSAPQPVQLQMTRQHSCVGVGVMLRSWAGECGERIISQCCTIRMRTTCFGRTTCVHAASLRQPVAPQFRCSFSASLSRGEWFPVLYSPRRIHGRPRRRATRSPRGRIPRVILGDPTPNLETPRMPRIALADGFNSQPHIRRNPPCGVSHCRRDYAFRTSRPAAAGSPLTLVPQSRPRDGRPAPLPRRPNTVPSARSMPDRMGHGERLSAKTVISKFAQCTDHKPLKLSG